MSIEKVTDHLFEATGIRFPKIYPEIVLAFAKHYGSLEKGLDRFILAINHSELVKIDFSRAYEGTPFEAQLGLATGGGGEAVGWVDLCPELPDFAKPCITFIPGGLAIEFHGLNDKVVLQNLASEVFLHPGFEQVDLEVFESFGIYPTQGNRSFESEACELTDPLGLPIIVPEGYTYLPTVDGTGVCAPTESFAANTKLAYTYEDKTADVYAEASDYFDAKQYGSALMTAKAAFRLYLFTSTDHNPKLLDPILALTVLIYAALGRDRVADVVRLYWGEL